MSRPPRRDPRRIGGSISGPGGPFDVSGVVIDARDALLLETVDVATVDPERGARGQLAAAVMVSGRINQTSDRAELVILANPDGLAALSTEIIGLISRAGEPWASEFRAAFDERMAQLPQPPEGET